jgi:WD40 repeat protein
VTPFDDLHDYIAIPRVSGLRLSPDGTWLAATVQQPGPDGKKFVTSVWRIPTGIGPDGTLEPDPPGGQPRPVRLTSSAQGEDSPVFLPDGSLLFISARPDPSAGPDSGWAEDSAKPALWLHPADGGDARRLAAPPGGVNGVTTADRVPGLVFTTPILPGAEGVDEDTKRRQERKDSGITAILHEAARLRYWDHDLGPDQQRLMAATVSDGSLAEPPRMPTPDPGRALDEQCPRLTPDGSHVVTGWSTWDESGDIQGSIAVIDTATGQRRMLLSTPGVDYNDRRSQPTAGWWCARPPPTTPTTPRARRRWWSCRWTAGPGRPAEGPTTGR